MKTKYCKRWFAFILLATVIVACSDSQVTATVTNVPATATPTITLPPPTATIAPTATAIPLVWKQIYSGQDFERDTVTGFVIDPKDPDMLYVGTENAGIYKSIDGGLSWRPIQPAEISTDIRQSLERSLERYRDVDAPITKTASDGKSRQYRKNATRWEISENGGQSWREFSPVGYPISRAITFDQSGNVYVYRYPNLIKFSPDGRNRTALGNPDIGDIVTELFISRADANTIYASGNGLAVSKDGGLTWLKLNNGLGIQKFALMIGMGVSPILYTLMGDCIDLGGNKGMNQPLYRSLDGGTNWEFVNVTGCHLVKDANGATVYRIDDHSAWIWRSRDRGSSWEKVPIPINPLSVQPRRIITFVAHPSKSGTLHAYFKESWEGNFEGAFAEYISEDYGHKWKRKDSQPSAKPCYGSTLQFIDAYRPMAIDPFDGNHVFVIDNGMLLESHNSCDTTQTFATTPNTNMNSIAFDPNQPGMVYAG
ncbi:MAG: hypothetical protein Q7T89_15310, partial [Anaerolineales bacterium]|nr:hypothetical protein [Anaerolineales bacterium]